MKYPIQRLQLKRRKEKRKRKPIPRIIIPSFFTLMNLFCGFLSIIMVAEGNLVFGAWLIVVAWFFDGLDGFMARLANATSEFGLELDSLSDVISFGAAPGFLIYSFALNELAIIGIILSALPPVCGAVRLARFNVDSKIISYDFYNGLPIPVQAVMLSAFTLTFHDKLHIFDSFEHGVLSVIIPAIVVISFLMVSTIPFDKLPKFDRKSIKKHKNRLIQFFVYLVIIAIFHDIGLIVVFSFYVLKALALGLYVFWKRAFTDESDSFDEMM
ncbi:MAG: CDP-diacylglycerol--serine O-phosphatidyltransferase [Balneolaceae bacterium]